MNTDSITEFCISTTTKVVHINTLTPLFTWENHNEELISPSLFVQL